MNKCRTKLEWSVPIIQPLWELLKALEEQMHPVSFKFCLSTNAVVRIECWWTSLNSERGDLVEEIVKRHGGTELQWKEFDPPQDIFM